MGSAMARELVAAGHRVSLWNRTSSVVDAIIASIDSDLMDSSPTASQALSQADIAICTLADGVTTQSVLLSDHQTLAGANRDLIIIDMGTSGVDAAKALNAGITSAGLRFVDAPVSGSVSTIAAHQLLVMASGNQAAIEEVTPTLLAFAKKVAHLGEAGTGQVMKLAVNLIVHTLDSAVAEALAIAVKSGISPSSAYDVLDESVIAAPFVKYKRAAFLDSKAPVAMRIDTSLKDLFLINQLAARLDLRLQTAPAVQKAFSEGVEAGLGEKDMARLVELFLH
jgi:3-hydroxyisobutyrate dehydrogenase-like beta-hydroxyacid dehydrogenase